MKLIRTGILLVVVFFASCKKNQHGDLTIEFHTQLDGSDCDLMTPFTNSAGQQLKIELLKFYISDIVLVNNKGDEKLLSEIELITIDNNGDASMTFEAPVGDYETLKFGIGVPAPLNEADPSNYNDEGNPLNTTEGMYWDMNAMYRFVSIDGRYDIEPDGTDDGTLSYHSGYEDSYRNYTFSIQKEVEKNGSATIAVLIDLKKIICASGNEIDVVSTPYYHGNLTDFYLSIMLSDNFQSAISVE